jgi:hypothetical protein
MTNTLCCRVVVTLVGAVALLVGCSTVGPGLKNHPGDCAIGIPWADCLPGTPGYNNGGGRVHREAAKAQNDAIVSAFQATAEQCKADFATPELDAIRHKVELFRESMDAAVPFEIASNDTFPTDDDRPVIARWATLRDECLRRSDALSGIPPTASAMQVAFLQQSRSFYKQAAASTSDLIVALYQQKLTYGEFGRKRYEIGKDAAAAELAFRQAALDNDQQRQMQAQQLAQQQSANNLAAWSAYIQAVNARQPQTVHIDGTIRLQHN